MCIRENESIEYRACPEDTMCLYNHNHKWFIFLRRWRTEDPQLVKEPAGSLCLVQTAQALASEQNILQVSKRSDVYKTWEVAEGPYFEFTTKFRSCCRQDSRQGCSSQFLMEGIPPTNSWATRDGWNLQVTQQLKPVEICQEVAKSVADPHS